jgi:hypothetical protein
LIGFYDYYENHPANRTICILGWCLYGFSLLNLFISFFAIIIIGPGYLPFNYSLNRQFWHDLSWQQQCSLFVVYNEQEQFAKSHPRPPRACFSRNARRFVLRADHYCIWTESWIGLRNHRYFILMTFWTFIYIFIWLGLHYWWALEFLPWTWWHLVQIVAAVALLPALGLSIAFFGRAVLNLWHNVLLLELWNGRIQSQFDHGCFRNFEEVCGSAKCCLCWPCPIVPLTPPESGLYTRVIDGSVPVYTSTTESVGTGQHQTI